MILKTCETRNIMQTPDKSSKTYEATEYTSSEKQINDAYELCSNECIL